MGKSALVVVIVIGSIAIFSLVVKNWAPSYSTPIPPTIALKAVLTVTKVSPEFLSLPLKISANGNITAWQEASVGTEANGLRLRKLNVNIGDQVQAGQILAEFATETLEAELSQANAAVTESRVNAAEAKANADRARQLELSGAMSTQQIQQYLSAERVTQAKLRAVLAVENTQKLRLAQAQVTAPEAGIISDRVATIGSVVAAGQELFRLILSGRIEWRAEVSASDLAKLKPGQRVTVVATGGHPLAGRVRAIAPTVDTLTRNGLVYVDLPADNETLVGMFAQGEFEIDNVKALTIPQSALLLRDGFSYVFCLETDSRVAQTKVITGQRFEDRVVILEGLKDNDTVVTSGVGFLSDGNLVRVVEDVLTRNTVKATSEISL